MTIDEESITSVEDALIIMYYRHSDLDLNMNGISNDTEDINEATLSLYMYDTATGRWIKLSDDLEWVIAVGVNTTDISVYGEQYAGYVWARITHLSLFGIAGQQYSASLPWMSITIIVLTCGAFTIGLVVIFQKRRIRKESE